MKKDLRRTVIRSKAIERTNVDAGLRAYFLRIYNYMALGLGLTGVVALFVASSPALLQAIYGSGLHWVVALAPLGFALAFGFGIHRMSASTAQGLFWAFAAVMGVSLSWIFIVYTQMSIAKVFFLTAGTFAGMSLYGYTTGRDLTNFGAFLMMGLIGLILVSLVNLFLKSSGLEFMISLVGIGIFIGLTAYDTQKLKFMYLDNDMEEVATKKAVMGALTLYMDFINLFLFFLRFLGDRR